MFKVGDKVFDYQYGWGVVEEIWEDITYPVDVNFERSVNTYTSDGRELEDNHPSLSFTEYTLEGFSQERPFNPEDCVGKWCILDTTGDDSESIVVDKVVSFDGTNYVDRDKLFWKNAKLLTEEQLKAFNLKND